MSFLLVFFWHASLQRINCLMVQQAMSCWVQSIIFFKTTYSCFSPSPHFRVYCILPLPPSTFFSLSRIWEIGFLRPAPRPPQSNRRQFPRTAKGENAKWVAKKPANFLFLPYLCQTTWWDVWREGKKTLSYNAGTKPDWRRKKRNCSNIYLGKKKVSRKNGLNLPAQFAYKWETAGWVQFIILAATAKVFFSLW